MRALSSRRQRGPGTLRENICTVSQVILWPSTSQKLQSNDLELLTRWNSDPMIGKIGPD